MAGLGKQRRRPPGKARFEPLLWLPGNAPTHRRAAGRTGLPGRRRTGRAGLAQPKRREASIFIPGRTNFGEWWKIARLERWHEKGDTQTVGRPTDEHSAENHGALQSRRCRWESQRIPTFPYRIPIKQVKCSNGVSWWWPGDHRNAGHLASWRPNLDLPTP